MAIENPFKTMILEPPWLLVATAQKIKKEEVCLGAKHEWLREHGFDYLDDETALQMYAIFMKMRLSVDTVHAPSYYYYQLILFEEHLAAA